MRLKNSEFATTAKVERPSITTYLKGKEPPGFLAVLLSVAIVISLPMLCITMLGEYEQSQNRICEISVPREYQNHLEEYRTECESIGWFDTSPTEDFGIDPQINEGFATESNLGPDGAFYWIGYSLLSLFLLCGLGSYVSRDFRQRKALTKAERKQLSIVRKLALDPDGVVEGRIVLPEPVPESVPKKYEIRVVKLIITMMIAMILFSIFGFASEVFGDSGDFGVKREAAEFRIMIFGAYIAGTFAVAATCFIVGHLTLVTIPGEEESLIPKSMIKESPVEQKEENILPYEAKKLEKEKQEKESQAQKVESKSQINDWEVQEEGWDINPTILNTLISCFLIIGPMFVIIVTGGEEIRLVIGGYVVQGIALMLSMMLGGLSMWVFISAALISRWCNNNEIYHKVISGTENWDNNVKLFLGALVIINVAILFTLPIGLILLGFELLFLLELRKRHWKSQQVTENQDGTWSKKKEKKVARKREGPVTMTEIVSVMESKLAEAVAEAESLKVNLVQTQEKVVTLEREVVSKDFDIIELEEVKEQIEVELKEKMEKVNDKSSKESDDDKVSKELSLQDSVMVGDALFGSTKIDKQIVNDPEAIARAAIAAYRQGKEDGGHKRPDILL